MYRNPTGSLHHVEGEIKDQPGPRPGHNHTGRATTRFSTWSSATASRFLKSHSPPLRRRLTKTIFAKASLSDGRTAPRSISTVPPSTALTIGQAPIPSTCPLVPVSSMRRTITALCSRVHSTGHECRLNRTFGDRFGDELYSKEELVAEMGAAFLCAIAGIANEHVGTKSDLFLWLISQATLKRPGWNSHGE